MTLDEHIAAAEAEGWEVVQEGRITRPPEQGVAFSERALGFNFGKTTTSATRSGEDRLFDDAERWVHMRRKGT